MLNSINNNIEITNSIDNLSFLWVACDYNDNLFFQYLDKKETRFNKEWFTSSALKYFCLYHKENSLYFLVDLVKGNLSFMNYEDKDNEEKKNNIRLIYFRRNRIEITGDKQNHTIVYHLGYQYLDFQGNNKKVILEINSDGSFVIRS
jgi:hypothetical protein